MKTTTFTCTKGAEEIEKSARDKMIMYKIMMGLCPVAVLLSAYVTFYPHGELVLNMYMISLFVLVLVLMGFVFWMFLKVVERIPSKYELMPTKEFSWDETHTQFIYKDKDHTLRFKGDDIEKWVSFVNNRTNESTEIITLCDGEKIILEGEWNAEVHDFLNLNRTELALPKPKRWTWSYEVY